jgi:hypothetical protein
MTRNDLTKLADALKLPAKPRRKKKFDFTGEETVLEYRIKRYVKERLNAIGAYHHWPVQNGMGEPCLDCHGCYQGRYFAVETKRPGAVPTPRQDATIARIRAAGGEVFVVDSEEAARNLFIEIVEIEIGV